MIYAALWTASVLFLVWLAFCLFTGIAALIVKKRRPDYSHLTHDEILRQHGEKYSGRKEPKPMANWVPPPEAPTHEPPRVKLLVLRLPAKDAEGEFCKCGYPGCIGHEVLDTASTGPENAAFPGLTSPEVMAQMMERGSKFVRFDMEISRVPGNR